MLELFCKDRVVGSSFFGTKGFTYEEEIIAMFIKTREKSIQSTLSQ